MKSITNVSFLASFAIVSTLFTATHVTGGPVVTDLEHPFEWKDCGDQSKHTLVRFNELKVHPTPVIVSKTDELWLTSNISITGTIPSDSYVQLVINKTITLAGNDILITIPCVDNVGSCTSKLCNIFDLWYRDLICPVFEKAGHQCSCPITAGNFAAKDLKIGVPFAKISSGWAKLASGDYWIRFSIVDSTLTQTYACLDVKAYMKFQQ